MRCDASSLLLLFQQTGEESEWTRAKRQRCSAQATLDTSDTAAERQEQAWQGLWRSESKRRYSCKMVLGGIVKKAKLSRTMGCLEMGGKAEEELWLIFTYILCP